jgi:hypothetical protein
LGEIQLEKKLQEKKWGGGEVFIEHLGGVAIFLRPVENPGKYLAFDRVKSRSLKSMMKNC